MTKKSQICYTSTWCHLVSLPLPKISVFSHFLYNFHMNSEQCYFFSVRSVAPFERKIYTFFHFHYIYHSIYFGNKHMTLVLWKSKVKASQFNQLCVLDETMRFLLISKKYTIKTGRNEYNNAWV